MGEASVGKVLLSRFVRRSAGVNSSFFGVYYCLVSPVGLVELAAEQPLKAASEVERSGTERLSGFRRA